MLPEGSIAPQFTLQDQAGNTVSLEDFRGKQSVVLIFYPGDLTPGCTKQLCEIKDDYSKFKSKDAVVFGINPASAESHSNFIAKKFLPFSLLVDEGGSVAQAYDCKGMIATKRTVYVIDEEGNIRFAREGKPAVSEILSSIQV
ncbi:MAG: peroxiredoxin [Chitinispirillaceae bacterium]